jgi:hypothetical protein
MSPYVVVNGKRTYVPNWETLPKKPKVKKTFKNDDEFFEYTEKWREFYELESLIPKDHGIEEDVDMYRAGKTIFAKPKKVKEVTKKLIDKYKNDPNVDVEYYDDSRPNRTNTR